MNNRFLIIGVSVAAAVLIVLGIFYSRSSKNNVEAKQPVAKSDTSGEKLYSEAEAMKQDNKLGAAKENFQRILAEHPDYENNAAVQKELEQLNMDLIFTNAENPKANVHQVAPGETLGKLAKDFGTTIDLIKLRNNLQSDIIRVGQRLSIWTGKPNIFVDKSQNVLILKDGDEVVKVYSVSTGVNNSTPVGEFTITSKLKDPVWFNKGAVVPPESPANVLGSRWMGFEEAPGYGIHGTIDPDKIGQQVTAGCVRMKNEDVEQLYMMIPLNTKVVIVD